MVAKVALSDGAGGWPEEHVDLAIETMNREAIRNQPRRIDYERMSREHPKQKAALTRAKKSDDPMKILVAVEKAFDVWDEIGAWPDDWATWSVALDDVYFGFRRHALDEQAAFTVEQKLIELQGRVR
jgi:hypothetical protein